MAGLLLQGFNPYHTPTDRERGPGPRDTLIYDGRQNPDAHDYERSLRERGFALVPGVPTSVSHLEGHQEHFTHKAFKSLSQIYTFEGGGPTPGPASAPFMSYTGDAVAPELEEAARCVCTYHRETVAAVKRALPRLEAAVAMNQVARSTLAPPINPKTSNAYDGQIDPVAADTRPGRHEPGSGAHTDAIEAGALGAMQGVFGGCSEQLVPMLSANRYEVYWLNLWRNVDRQQPVRNYHLAVLDKSSLRREDTCERVTLSRSVALTSASLAEE